MHVRLLKVSMGPLLVAMVSAKVAVAAGSAALLGATVVRKKLFEVCLERKAATKLLAPLLLLVCVYRVLEQWNLARVVKAMTV